MPVCSLLHTSVIFEIHTRRIYCEQLPRNFADLHKILFKLIDFVCAVESDKAKYDEYIKIEEKAALYYFWKLIIMNETAEESARKIFEVKICHFLNTCMFEKNDYQP